MQVEECPETAQGQPATPPDGDGNDTTAAVNVWTDGSCSGNPGPGGWAAIVQREDGAERALTGHDAFTTNNRMELTAAIAALSVLLGRRKVIVRSDSKIVVQGMTEWLEGWRRKGWRKSNSKPVENRDLWERLAEVAERHDVAWEWVRGHAGDPMNHRVDRLAVAARDGRKIVKAGQRAATA